MPSKFLASFQTLVGLRGDTSTTPGGVPYLGKVGGDLAVGAVAWTRPSDATPYAAKDVVGNTGTAANLVFPNASRLSGGGGAGYITKVRLTTSQKANVTAHRLWLFNVNPAVIADNAPMAIKLANNANRLGAIDLPAFATEDATASDCAEALNMTVRFWYTTAAGDTNLYGILETLGAYTPDNAQTFHLALAFDRA